MNFIFILFFCIGLNGMEKKHGIEIPFSDDATHQPNSAVFIDENRIAIVGEGKGFIVDLITQKQDNFAIPQLNVANYSSVCLNESKELLGYISHGQPCIYNIKTKKTTATLKFSQYTHQVALGFNTNNDLIALENGNFSSHNEDEQIERCGSTFFPKPISCHLKNNIFLCCSNQSGFDYIDLKSNTTKCIKAPYFCNQVNCSPCGKWIVIRDKRCSIFINTWTDKFCNEILLVKKIGSRKNRYSTFAFYPKNNFLALLSTKGSLEYRNYTKPHEIIASQQVIKKVDHNFPLKSIRFSPNGSKAMIIINGKCMLLDVPLDIQYPNGWLIYYCVKSCNIPKEIFCMFMDLLDSIPSIN